MRLNTSPKSDDMGLIIARQWTLTNDSCKSAFHTVTVINRIDAKTSAREAVANLFARSFAPVYA